MKRLSMIMMCLLAMMATSLSVKAQEITINLFPGWNWISYTNAEAMDISTALGDFVPMEGDMIKSRYGQASYYNGLWRGSMRQFTPGLGYHYYSMRGEPVSFVFASTAPQLIVTTVEPTDITATSAMSGGSLSSSDGSYIVVLEKGICWATHPNPTAMNDHHTENGSGSDSFMAEMTDLSANTVYYVRAYAVTQNGTTYGDEMSFITHNHEYVDLGLPSGTLWATCNVGANVPEEYGDYFAWGETQPKSTYAWSTYQYCNLDGYSYGFTKYCNDSSYGFNGFTDNQTVLLPEDDAATVNWGNEWRMPTEEEWRELYQNTTNTTTTQNGVKGRLFIGSNGNSLFLPAAGIRVDSLLYDAGDFGEYWSSSLRTDYPNKAMRIWFSGVSGMSGSGRCVGMSVRPVRSSRQN